MANWRFFTLVSSCASLALLSPMIAAAQAGAEPALQKPLWGAEGGAPVTLAIPEDAEFSGMVVYSGLGVNGLQLRYRMADGRIGETALAGTAAGTREEVSLQPGEIARFISFSTVYIWPNIGNPANHIQKIGLATNQRSIDLGNKAGKMLTLEIAKIGPGTTFGGLFIRADNTVRAMAGLAPRANVAQQAPPPPPAYQPSNQPSQMAMAQPQQMQQPQQVQQAYNPPAQQPVAAPVGGESDLAFNPFGESEPAGGGGSAQTSTQGYVPPQQVSTAQPNLQSQAAVTPRQSNNPFTSGGGNAAANAQAAADAIAAANAARAAQARYDGAWVEVGKAIEQPERNLDDAIGSGQYIAPRTLQVTGFSPTWIVIENVNTEGQDARENRAARAPRIGSGVFSFKSSGPGLYTGDFGTVEIVPGADDSEDLMKVRLSGGWAFLSGNFERARIADDKTLARDRDLPAVKSSRDTRASKFANLVTLFTPSITGHDPVEMSPFAPREGVKARIFEQLGDTDYSFDDGVSVNVPYGLRGVDANASVGKSTSVTVTSAAETQKQLSLTMGVSAFGFGANFAAEKTTTNSAKSEIGREYSFVRLSRYALVLDLPSMRLSREFRRRVEELAAGGTDYQGFLDTFGTHYANAVTYGALGFASTETNSSESTATLAEKFNVGANGEYKGIEANGGGGSGNTNSNTSGSSSSNSVYQFIGGSGTGDGKSVQANDDRLVPILYDLRPIPELINAALFPTGADAARRQKLQMVRIGLGNAISARNQQRPKLDDKAPPTGGSAVWRLAFRGIKCRTRDGRREVSLAGNLNVKIMDSFSVRTVAVINHPMPTAETEPLKVPCGNYPAALSVSQAIIRGADAPLPTFEFRNDFDLKNDRLYQYIPHKNSSLDDANNSFIADLGAGIVGDSKGLAKLRGNIVLKSSIPLSLAPGQIHAVYQSQKLGVIAYNAVTLQSNDVEITIPYTIERMQ